MQANAYKNMSSDEIEKMSYLQSVAWSFPSAMKASLDQSFLQGTNTLLNAIQDGGWKMDKWLINTTGAMSASLYPNTLASISKAGDEYIRDTKGVDLSDSFVSFFKNRMFMGEDLPSKITLWGEKVPNVPNPDKNAYVHYLLDVTNKKTVDTEYFGYKIYDLWKKTNDSNVLPTPPSNTIQIRGEKILLSSDLYEEYQINVGKYRKSLIRGMVESSTFKDMPDEQKIKTLTKLYSDGQAAGKNILLSDNPELIANLKK